MPRQVLAAIFAVGALLVGSGCSTEKIYVSVVRASAVDLGRYQNIAVDAFNGRGGEDLAEDLTVRFTNATSALTGARSVAVVDRKNFDNLMRELQRQRGDLWNQDTIVRLGRLVGAAALVHGRVSTYRYNETMQQDRWKDKQNNQHTTYTRVGTAQISAYLQVADTETARLLDSMKYNEHLVEQQTGYDELPPAIDGDGLLASLRGVIVEKFLKRVLPYTERVAVTLFVDGDFPDLKVGNNYAAVGAWDKALESYQKALDQMVGELAEYRYRGLYNMGVGYGYRNEFDKARTTLQEAYALYADDMISQELASLARREADYRKLFQSQSASPENAP